MSTIDIDTFTALRTAIVQQPAEISHPGSLAAIAGYPHLTVPMGEVEGLPVGLSFIGPKWSDKAVLEAGAAYENARTVTLPVPDFKRWGE